MILFAISMFANLFIFQNREFFNTAADEMQDGASWHYVGPQDLDPTAKALPLEGGDGEKYILWKLKK